MLLRELSLRNFRNIEEAEMSLSGGINVINGENAQGKTNLLEAVYFLSCVRSFRASKEAELIRFGQSCAELSGTARRDAAPAHADRLFIRLHAQKKRELSINGVGKTLSDFCGALPAVLFLPEDLGLVQGGAAGRRRLIDMTLSQLRPNYRAALSQYNRSLAHKLRALKDCEKKPSLADTVWAFNHKLAETGAVIIGYRARFLKKLSAHAAGIHAEISDGREALGMEYKTDSRVKDPFVTTGELKELLYLHMEERRAAEFAAKSCLIGPHRDDVEITINGLNARAYASQGQARTAALAIKLAERTLMREDTGENPLLLLDDVLSELDAIRRDYVLNRISGGQVIITTCGETVPRTEGLFFVQNGQVKKG